MSQKLCADCKKLFEEVMCPNEKISRWVHCHHEEKKGCVCCMNGQTKGFYLVPTNCGEMREGWKFCPECGREL